jgi:hypothetical protein
MRKIENADAVVVLAICQTWVGHEPTSTKGAVATQGPLAIKDVGIIHPLL